MRLSEINQIKHFSGKYILTSNLKNMKIHIDLIDVESLPLLKIELDKLNAEWT